jgi:hypothetical protein
MQDQEALDKIQYLQAEAGSLGIKRSNLRSSSSTDGAPGGFLGLYLARHKLLFLVASGDWLF